MYRRSLNLTAALLAVLTIVASSPGQDDFKSFAEVSKGYEKVISTTDGSETLYGLWINRKKEQLIAELPRGWQSQRHYIAVTEVLLPVCRDRSIMSTGNDTVRESRSLLLSSTRAHKVKLNQRIPLRDCSPTRS